MTFAQAAALPVPFYTAYRALFTKLGVRPGRRILIHGATGELSADECNTTTAD
jgi:NADPH:quinone reductase-like Zn-dependent oxidoreductase